MCSTGDDDVGRPPTARDDPPDSRADDGLGDVLDAALDGLAADDLAALSAPELLARCAALVQAANRVAAELTRTVRAADRAGAARHDGLVSMASWLRGHARLSPRAASGVVKAGRTLEHLPVVAAGFTAGAVTPQQVDLLAPTVTPDALTKAAEQDVDLGEIDAAFAAVATGQVHQQLAGAVARYLGALDPDGPEPDPTEGRTLTLVTHADGSVTGRFTLDAVAGEALQAALEAFCQADRPGGDLRTRAQRLGDALAQLADVALACGRLPVLRGEKPRIGVLVRAEDLADPRTRPAAAEAGFGARLSAARARRIACDSQVARIVLGPDSQPLDVGRAHRTAPPHLRRAVEARDRACVFAGCDAPTHWCEVHHVLHWAFDGPTSLANSALLCERHHTRVHAGFRVQREADGRWRTWRPDGTEILPAPTVAHDDLDLAR